MAVAPIRLPLVAWLPGFGELGEPLATVPTTALVIVAVIGAALVLWLGRADAPRAVPLYVGPTRVSAACAPPAAISAIATAAPMLLRLNMGALAARRWILRAFMV